MSLDELLAGEDHPHPEPCGCGLCPPPWRGHDIHPEGWDEWCECDECLSYLDG